MRFVVQRHHAGFTTSTASGGVFNGVTSSSSRSAVLLSMAASATANFSQTRFSTTTMGSRSLRAPSCFNSCLNYHITIGKSHVRQAKRYVSLRGSPHIYVPLKERRQQRNKNKRLSMSLQEHEEESTTSLTAEEERSRPPGKGVVLAHPSRFGTKKTNHASKSNLLSSPLPLTRRGDAGTLMSSQSQQERPPDPATLLTNDEIQMNGERLAEWIYDNNKGNGGGGILCITGAGLSTESGIPDYRGSNGSYHRGHKPMLHDEFMSSELQRKRYWARALMGWRTFASKQPNQGHYAMTTLEELGYLGVHDFECNEEEDGNRYDHLYTFPSHKRLTTITQNVDELHQKSNMSYVIDLHGTVSRIKCMSCGHTTSRDSFHTQLETFNHEWIQEQEQLRQQQQQLSDNEAKSQQHLRPDGDATLMKDNYEELIVPACSQCGTGFYKADVVFFGGTVPPPRVRLCYNAVKGASAILCIGTSLATHSAFRFVAEASKQSKPIAILNVGPTRADTAKLPTGLFTKIESPIGATLVKTLEALT